jgi:hypothetical protein
MYGRPASARAAAIFSSRASNTIEHLRNSDLDFQAFQGISKREGAKLHGEFIHPLLDLEVPPDVDGRGRDQPVLEFSIGLCGSEHKRP